LQKESLDLVDTLSANAWGLPEDNFLLDDCADVPFFPQFHGYEAEMWQQALAQDKALGSSHGWSATGLHAGQKSDGWSPTTLRAGQRPEMCVATGESHPTPLPESASQIVNLRLASLFESPTPTDWDVVLRHLEMDSHQEEPIMELPTQADLNASTGSTYHGTGQCRPCVFFHKVGCRHGVICPFCHLCKPEERKKRRWQKLHEQQRLRRQEARRVVAEEKEKQEEETRRMAEQDVDVGKHDSAPVVLPSAAAEMKQQQQEHQCTPTVSLGRGVSSWDVPLKDVLLRPPL
jgi:hypothetical protein